MLPPNHVEIFAFKSGEKVAFIHHGGGSGEINISSSRLMGITTSGLISELYTKAFGKKPKRNLNVKSTPPKKYTYKPKKK
jgi:hypothetical protein